VKDVCEFLDRLGMPDPPALAKPLKVAYQDACHLVHGQRVKAAPRALLQRIPNLTMMEIPDGGYCCGSAGTYNIDQPEIARTLGERKAAAIRETGAEAVASGNIGCLTQIRTHLQALGADIAVMHTVEILDRAFSGGSR
jgi:glycolate oxidase iron-sulfur subunit